MYGEAMESLSKADTIAKEDVLQIKELKQNTDDDGTLDFVIDLFNTSRKALRFSKAAAPLILADGPLPFGDAIFVAALGLDFALAAYDLITD
jgi:hypothetical protein